MRSGGSQEGLVCPISEGLYIYIYIAGEEFVRIVHFWPSF